MDEADRIADAVSRRTPVNGMRIVGVDGRSGAGKSFLAGRLSSLLAAPVIEIDDFVSWECFAGWWPRFDDQVLSPLLAGRDATYQVRDTRFPGKEELWRRWMREEDDFFGADGTRERADCIVDTSAHL